MDLDKFWQIATDPAPFDRPFGFAIHRGAWSIATTHRLVVGCKGHSPFPKIEVDERTKQRLVAVRLCLSVPVPGDALSIEVTHLRDWAQPTDGSTLGTLAGVTVELSLLAKLLDTAPDGKIQVWDPSASLYDTTTLAFASGPWKAVMLGTNPDPEEGAKLFTPPATVMDLVAEIEQAWEVPK